MKEIKLGAIYTRVSTEEQKRGGYSLEAQEAELKKYAESKGIKVVRTYSDGGYSGKDFSRPEFQNMLKDMERGEFDSILAWRVDRVSRNNKDVLTLIENVLKPRNCNLLINIGDIDSSTDNGFMMISLLGTIAQHERNSIIGRVKLGMNKRAQDGLWNGGLVYGYDSVEKQLVINKEESEVVKEIYNLRIKGLGYKAIACHLNEKGIRTKRGKLFSINGVKTILENPLYIGKNRWASHEDWSSKRRAGKQTPIIVEGKHQPIIEIGVWEKAQAMELVNKMSLARNPNTNGEYIISGMLRCPQCDAGTVMYKTLKYDGTGYNKYYMCQAYHSKGRLACSTNLIPKDEIEQQVISAIKNIICNENVLKDVWNRYLVEFEQDSLDLKRDIQLLEKKVKEVNDKINLINKDYFNKTLPAQKYAQFDAELQEELSPLAQKLDELNREYERKHNKVNFNIELVRDVLTNFDSVFELSSNQEKKKLLRSIIKRIDVEEDRKTLKSITLWVQDKLQLPSKTIGRTVS